jgi:hypothetical protein
MTEQRANEQVVYARIRAEMATHLQTHGAPDEIHDFLTRHWARLMTGIYMAKGNQDADWFAGWDTVNALLWSLAPKQGRDDAERMLRMLPTLLERLHEGCAALAIPDGERDALFERLAMMHAAVAREGLRYQAGLMRTMTHLSSGDDVADRSADLAELTPPPAEVVDAGKINGGLPALKPGDRVLIALHGRDRLMVLNWISPVGGMYLFTNEHGLDALTFTRARLTERFRTGQARLAERA